MSLFSNLSIGSQALLSFQKGISTVNKNMTNVSTEGYKREIPTFSNFPTQGVNFAEAKRVYDDRLFNRMIDVNQQNSYYEELGSNLGEIEKIFSDNLGTGFGDALNEFFNSMNDIITSPDSLAARDSFLAATQTLVGRIRDSYSALNDIKTTNQQSIQDNIRNLNDKLHALAKINKTIKTSQNNNEALNTALNQRDQLLKDISGFIDTKVRYNSDNTVDLFSAKGHALVLYDKNFNLDFKTVQENVTLTDSSDTLTYTKKSAHILINGADLTNEFKSGKIGAKIETDKKTDEYIQKLNSFAFKFAKEVNSVQTNGYDLNGNSGDNLFINENTNNATNIDASNIKLNFLDPNKVAASNNAAELQSNNENIKDMQKLKETTFSFLDNQSFNEYYNSSIVAKIGFDKNHTDNLYEEKSGLLESIQNKIDSLSGVNMDEELIELTQLQRSYQASARIISVTDELLQTALGLVS